MELVRRLVTPGWSNPKVEKPHPGLPGDLSGLRDLDVGFAKGHSSFVLIFGFLYRLQLPFLALEKAFEVCSGASRMLAASVALPGMAGVPFAQFFPFREQSGTPAKPFFDETVSGLPNADCADAMLAHVGFRDVETVSTGAGAVFRAQAPRGTSGLRPVEAKAPWC